MTRASIRCGAADLLYQHCLQSVCGHLRESTISCLNLHEMCWPGGTPLHFIQGMNEPSLLQVAVGDMVDVKRGAMSDKAGTVKYIFQGSLFLHSR